MERLKRARGYSRQADESEEEEGEALLGRDTLQLGSLHPKKRGDWSPGRQQPRDQTIECDIQPADTLLSLSLKYNIPVAELKRVNNIINEAEFFALKRIKIPVQPTSLLTDLLPGVHSEERRNNNGWYVESKESPQGGTSGLTSRVSTGCSSPYSEAEADTEASPSIFHESRDKKKVKKFLKEMDKDLDRLRDKQTEFEGLEGADLNKLEVDHKVTGIGSTTAQSTGGWSGRVLGYWCCLLTLLVVIVFCVLVMMMRIKHEFHSELWDHNTSSDHSASPQPI